MAAPVATGAISISTATASPTFGAATTAGNTLIATVTAKRGTTLTAITCSLSGSGWTKDKEQLNGASGGVAIWRKSNCGAGETAPTFSTTGTGTNDTITAQLTEWLGVWAVDKSGSGITTPNIACGSADNDGGETIITVDFFDEGVAVGMTAPYLDALNNGATWTKLSSNDALVNRYHWRSGYGTTTGHASADTNTVADVDLVIVVAAMVSYSRNGTGTGAPGTVTLSAAAAAAVGGASTTGAPGTVTLSAPAGAGAGGGSAAGAPGTLSLSGIAGAAVGAATGVGALGTQTLSVIFGTASGFFIPTLIAGKVIVGRMLRVVSGRRPRPVSGDVSHQVSGGAKHAARGRIPRRTK